MRRFAVGMLSLFTAGLDASVVNAQDFPSKPIRIVTGDAGGGTDFGSRLIAQGISGPLGRPVIVENHPTGVIPGQIVAQASADGYTLLLTSPTLWMGPLLQDNVPYDPVKDFSPVTLSTRAPNILVVHPSIGVESVKELIALAKAKPGTLNFSSGGTGSTSHLAGELFKSLADVNIVRIPYSSSSLEYGDLLSGQVQMTFAGAATAAPHVKAGKLRALAVTTAQPSVLAPGLPTIAAAGVPGYEAVSIHAIFAPAKTPAAVINRLNQEIVRALGQEEIKQKFLNAGIEPVGSSPERLADAVKSEMARMGKVIKEAGIRAK